MPSRRCARPCGAVARVGERLGRDRAHLGLQPRYDGADREELRCHRDAHLLRMRLAGDDRERHAKARTTSPGLPSCTVAVDADALELVAQRCGRAGQQPERAVMPGDDLGSADQADRVGGLARPHGVVVADREDGDRRARRSRRSGPCRRGRPCRPRRRSSACRAPRSRSPPDRRSASRPARSRSARRSSSSRAARRCRSRRPCRSRPSRPRPGPPASRRARDTWRREPSAPWPPRRRRRRGRRGRASAGSRRSARSRALRATTGLPENQGSMSTRAPAGVSI